MVLITDFGLDPLSVDDNSNTPLHMSCLGGHTRLLITKYNCPVDVINKNNYVYTPLQNKGLEGLLLLHQACIAGHTKLAMILITVFGLILSQLMTIAVLLTTWPAWVVMRS
jgi:ankyrin repeat protein